MSKRLKDYTDGELIAELNKRGSAYMGKQARDESDPIPAGDPTRPGKDMSDPLEGDEISGLETDLDEEDRTQESDGEVGGELRDDTDEDVDDGDQTTSEPGEQHVGDAGEDLDHKTSDQSKGPV